MHTPFTTEYKPVTSRSLICIWISCEILRGGVGGRDMQLETICDVISKVSLTALKLWKMYSLLPLEKDCWGFSLFVALRVVS